MNTTASLYRICLLAHIEATVPSPGLVASLILPLPSSRACERHERPSYLSFCHASRASFRLAICRAIKGRTSPIASFKQFIAHH